jgi:hypothetical protein
MTRNNGRDCLALFVNDETGEKTEHDPRLRPEVLLERGVALRVFDVL